MAYFIGQRLAAPIKAANEKLLGISTGEGDLTERLKITTRDETGQLSGHFNNFIENLQTIIKDIKVEADQSVEIQNALETATESTSESLADMNTVLDQAREPDEYIEPGNF